MLVSRRPLAARDGEGRPRCDDDVVGLGIGDRHVQNILVDMTTAEVIHIDFGIAFEQGRVLPHPELIPFRLTRDIVAPMGVSGVDGVYRK